MATTPKRPKLIIPKNKSEWVWDGIGFPSYIGSILLLIINWDSLPDQVPAHYNAIGEVTRWGAKWELLILPSIGVFILVLMQLFEKYPEMHNYPQRLNATNAEQFYQNSRKMINQIKNICLILFAYILYASVSIALD
ncbi:putative membrane protein [Oceanobacillus polygoni]|uniref:Membrane protein n=1 Tax=Oceanobacillus polygoni TaxID=1235259 RepID=A0A9X1CIC4_9BACI|nr:putative membrane protein [Oceanobacillus polygoni]